MPHARFLKTIKAFLATKLTRQVRELYLSASMVSFAVAMVAIFEPIYLYSRGFSLHQVLFFYLVIYSIYLFTIPLGAKFARKFGYEKSILLGTPFLALYYISLHLISINYLFVLVAVIAFAAQKSFYWPGFHADFARFGKNNERGREISNIMVITSILYIIGPFLGGLLISVWGFKLLFTVATILILASNLPLLSTPEKFKPTPFAYKDSFKRLFAKENRRNFFGFMGYGEELLSMVMWPIFIFIVVKDFLSVGSLVALATLTTTIVLLFVGKMVDVGHSHRRSILRMGTIFRSGSWLLRLLVNGTLGVFLVDSLGRTSKNVIVVPMMAMTYERAGDTSVMKTVIFFEQALIIGKISAILLSIIALWIIPNSFALLFIIGALMTLLFSLIKYEPIKIKN
jgi:MFS family permease